MSAARTISINVNGVPRQAVARDATPLLYVLRNDFGLKATRFGCGLGLCGACVVQVDGAPAFSCDTPMWAVEGKSVRTAEDVSSNDRLKSAFDAEQVGQCGYCLSGILMQADALLRQTPHPTSAQICEALDRHLCHCGSHGRIVRAIETAAAIAIPP